MKFLIKFIYIFKKLLLLLLLLLFLLLILLLLLLLSSSLSLLLHWRFLMVIRAEGFTLELLDDYQPEMQESKALA